MVAWPGHLGPAGRTIDLPVSHLDIVPTLAALVGATDADVPAGLPGESLAGVLRDPTALPPWGHARRVRYGLTYRGAVGNKWNIFRWAQNKRVETAEPLLAFSVTGGRKVIVDFARQPHVEVYDLASDPAESHPLDSNEAPGQDALGRSVLDWYARTQTNLSALPPTASDLENLRSLGYVE